MPNDHERQVVNSFKALREEIARLPESPEAAAIRAELNRLEQGLRDTGFELGRPEWMR